MTRSSAVPVPPARSEADRPGRPALPTHDALDLAVPARPPRAFESAAHFVLANELWHHVLEYGSGCDVVLIPGIVTCAASLSPVARQLAKRVGVFVVDVRGRGLSDHPADGFAVTDYAADLAGVIERLRLTAPVVVGHSMGARIAAALDVARPGLCGGLVLVDPPLSGPGRSPYPYPLEMYMSMLDSAHADDPLPRLRRAEPTASDESLEHRIRWLRAIDEHAVSETHRNFHVEDFHRLYTNVTAPSLLVRGVDSVVVTAQSAAELAALRPDIPVVEVAGAGHLVPQENPDALCAIVATFAEDLAGGAAQPPPD